MPAIRFVQNGVSGNPGVGYEGAVGLPVTMIYEGGSGGPIQWRIEDVGKVVATGLQVRVSAPI